VDYTLPASVSKAAYIAVVERLLHQARTTPHRLIHAPAVSRDRGDPAPCEYANGEQTLRCRMVQQTIGSFMDAWQREAPESIDVVQIRAFPDAGFVTDRKARAFFALFTSIDLDLRREDARLAPAGSQAGLPWGWIAAGVLALGFGGYLWSRR
jgi:hypothetical protein